MVELTKPAARRPTRAGSAVERIVARIDAERLAPGDPLPSEARLMSDLGVSRVVVREALKMLEGQGVVEARGGRGTVVRRPDMVPLLTYFAHVVRVDDNSLVELMELRAGLEVFGARLAAQRRTAAEARDIARTAREMREALHDFDRFAERDVAFHIAIAAAGRNALLSALMVSIREAMRGAVLAGLKRRRGDLELARVQELHEEIAAAIMANDADRAATTMDRHFREAVAALVQE